MLTPEELRIGNYIIGKTVDGFRDIFQQVLELTQKGIAVSPYTMKFTGRAFELVEEVDIDRPLLYGWANGIPIDEHWLSSLGFRVVSLDYGTFSKNGVMLVLRAGECQIFKEQVSVGRPLKFVHELQNIYAELTGNLLTLPRGITKPSLKEGFEL